MTAEELDSALDLKKMTEGGIADVAGAADRRRIVEHPTRRWGQRFQGRFGSEARCRGSSARAVVPVSSDWSMPSTRTTRSKWPPRGE